MRKSKKRRNKGICPLRHPWRRRLRKECDIIIQRLRIEWLWLIRLQPHWRTPWLSRSDNRKKYLINRLGSSKVMNLTLIRSMNSIQWTMRKGSSAEDLKSIRRIKPRFKEVIQLVFHLKKKNRSHLRIWNKNFRKGILQKINRIRKEILRKFTWQDQRSRLRSLKLSKS